MIKLTRSNVVNMKPFDIWVNEKEVAMIYPERTKGTVLHLTTGKETVVDETMDVVASMLGCTEPLEEITESEADVNITD